MLRLGSPPSRFYPTTTLIAFRLAPGCSKVWPSVEYSVAFGMSHDRGALALGILPPPKAFQSRKCLFDAHPSNLAVFSPDYSVINPEATLVPHLQDDAWTKAGPPIHTLAIPTDRHCGCG